MPLHYTDERPKQNDGAQLESNGDAYGVSNGGAQGESTATFTVEEAIEKLGFGWMQFRIYVTCKLVVATDAMEVMLLSLVGPIVQCEWSLQASQIAFMSTGVFLGMAVGSTVFGKMADHLGRKMALMVSTLLTAYFGLLTGFAPFYVWLVALRTLVGLGMGGIPQGYAMVAEYVPSKYRAKMIVCGEVFWGSGALFEIMLAALIIPTLGWRWLFFISSVPVFIASFCCMLMPESARYLVAADRREDARRILDTLSRVNNTALPPGALVKSKKSALGSFGDLFTKEYRLTTMLLWPIYFAGSFAYYGIVLASPLLLSDTNKPAGEECLTSTCNVLTTEDYISLAISTTGEFVGLLVSFSLIDRIGRRWTGVLLLTSAGIFLFLLQVPLDHWIKTLLIFGIRGTTLTHFNLCFIYTVEVYPTTVRAMGLGVATSWGRLASCITPFFAQMLIIYSVPLTVNIYGAVCLLAAVLMFMLPIETLGRPLMQAVSCEYSAKNEETECIVSGNH